MRGAHIGRTVSPDITGTEVFGEKDEDMGLSRGGGGGGGGQSEDEAEDTDQRREGGKEAAEGQHVFLTTFMNEENGMT